MHSHELIRRATTTTKHRRSGRDATRRAIVLAAAAAAFSAGTLAVPRPASADIFQWEYIDPADPSQGKRQSTTLAPGGAGANAVPNEGFHYRNLTKAYLIGADLTGAGFLYANLTIADFSQANLTNAVFGSMHLADGTLTGATFTGAQVRGADFDETTSHGFTAAQLYSTASYQSHDLSGINLVANDLTGWNFAGQNLTNVNFLGANLTNANFSHANLANVQLNTVITNANFTAADMRGAFFLPDASNIRTNLIHPNGHVAGLDLTAGKSLLVRNYHGNPAEFPPRGPLPIVVDQSMTMDLTGALRLILNSDTWDSGISFAPGIPVALGGTLELDFAPGVPLAAQHGRTIDLFDWTGVTPTGTFDVESLHLWDLANLYTSGDVTLLALVGDANADGRVDADDNFRIDSAFLAGGQPAHGWHDGDFNRDGTINADDYFLIDSAFLAQGSSVASAVATSFAVSVPEPAWLSCLSLTLLACRRRRQRPGRPRTGGHLLDCSIRTADGPKNQSMTRQTKTEAVIPHQH